MTRQEDNALGLEAIHELSVYLFKIEYVTAQKCHLAVRSCVCLLQSVQANVRTPCCEAANISSVLSAMIRRHNVSIITSQVSCVCV